MTDYRTSKLPKTRKHEHKIKLESGATIVGEGATEEEARKDAEGKAAFFGKNRQF